MRLFNGALTKCAPKAATISRPSPPDATTVHHRRWIGADSAFEAPLEAEHDDSANRTAGSDRNSLPLLRAPVRNECSPPKWGSDGCEKEFSHQQGRPLSEGLDRDGAAVESRTADVADAQGFPHGQAAAYVVGRGATPD